MTPKGCHVSQVNGLTDRQTGKNLIDLAEDRGQIGRGKGLAWRAIAWLLQQLREEFPKHLRIHGSQNAEESATGEQAQESKGADDLILPRREEEGAAGMLDFERWLFPKTCLVK